MKKSIFVLLMFFIFNTLSFSSPLRIMLLGDSITYDDAYSDHPSLGGTGVRPASLRHGYRNHLWYLLNDAKYNVDFVGSRSAGSAIVPPFDPDNEGYPGATSNDLANLIYNKLIQSPPDIILLYIGANDWSDSVTGINSILNNIDNYERDYYHPIKVIIARIVNRRTHQAWMTRLNRNIQALANVRRANGDDISVVEMETSAGINYSTDFQDPTHPNDVGYSKIAKAWFNALTPYMTSVPDFSWLPAINFIILD